MIRLERFIKTAGVYFLGNVFTKLVSFLLLPLYTNRISPDDYGTYGLVNSLINLLIPLVYFQIWDSIFRFTFDYERKAEKYRIISNGFVVMLMATLVYTVGFIGFSVVFDFEHKVLIFLYSLGIGIQYFYNYVARSLQKNSLFVISGSINSFLTIVINIILIVFFKRSIDSLYISSIIGILVQILIIEYNINILKNISLKNISKKIIRELIRFSAPLSINTISHWLLTGLTQLAISVQLGSYENGLFTVANKFSSMLVLLVSVFQFAWNETAYSLSASENKKSYYQKSITEILRITLLGSSIFLLIIRIIFPYFIDEQYNEALGIVPIVLLATTANSYSGFLGTIFLANKKSKNLTAATIISSSVNVIGLLILIPIWGLYGAVISLFIAFFVGAISRIIMLCKTEDIIPARDAFTPISLIIIAVIAFYKINNFILLILLLLLIGIISLISLKPLIKNLFDIMKSYLKPTKQKKY